MSKLAEKLKDHRREQQEMHHYSNSSLWYTGLSHTIEFLRRAEETADPVNRFTDTWSALWNLFTMHGEPGDEEWKAFARWVTTVKDYPGVRRFFLNGGGPTLLAFRDQVAKAKNSLLKEQGVTELKSWENEKSSADKACRYFFTIARDVRNSLAHPTTIRRHRQFGKPWLWQPTV